MKSISFFIAFLIAQVLHAQTTAYSVTGTVVDAVTKSPLQGASVFAQNTTIGTATAADGKFTLQVPNGGYDLVITFTGFETATQRISANDAGNNNVVIEMKQKEKAMQDVAIRASNEVKDGWEKYGDFFLESFIGRTANSKQCELKNKEDLKFYFSKRKNRLKVMSAVPLEIENRALGYTIKYALDSLTYEYDTQLSTYTGYPRFEEMASADTLQIATWKINRQRAYNGSILHFMRSLYNKTLKEDGFQIQFLVKSNGEDKAIQVQDYYAALQYEKIDSSQIVEVLPNQQDVAVLYTKEEPEALYISQRDSSAAKKFQLSILNTTPNEAIGIEQNGYYFDQNDITITGYWSFEKMADMLPYNYSPAKME